MSGYEANLIAQVVVVVPIYNAYGALRRCLASLQRTLSVRQPILLVDDASTDQRIGPLLTQFAVNRAHTEIVTHTANVGFVRSVNQAMAATNNDVVLLNSDTITTPQWLSRMMVCASSDARIATVTPFSNNAEICSFPQFCVANPVPEQPDQIADAMLDAGPPEYPDIPTAVGFCMLIRRRALDQLGMFDAQTFGHGYGEENDFCLRAAHAGWRNVLCDDAYVVHLGGQSFASLGLRPGGVNLERLVARWPDYNEMIARFIHDDPLLPVRQRILAALRRASETAIGGHHSER